MTPQLLRQRNWLWVVLVLALSLLFAGLASAQDGEPPDGPLAQSPEEETAVGSYIPVQGRLTNQLGAPLNGSYSITFSLYKPASGGTALCTDTNTVTVNNGLFYSYMGGCDSDDIKGQPLYLGIKVGTDAEMTPRQAIFPVPYAWSLRPGALISDASNVILTVRSTGAGESDAFVAYAANDGEAITAHAEQGVAVVGYSDQGVAIAGYTDNSISMQGYTHDTEGTHPSIYGCVGTTISCNSVRDDNAAGVMGYSVKGYGLYGVGGSAAAGGVYGEANSSQSVGLEAKNKSTGKAALLESNGDATASHTNPTLYLVQGDAGGDYAVGARTYSGTRTFRINGAGRGYFNGGTTTGGADYAEQIDIAGQAADYQPGDVLVISPNRDRQVERSSQAFSTAVIGVYSAEPGYLAGAPDTDDPLGGLPVAMMGIVPCKVSAENGAIQRGDLLVTAALPGHAMRAGTNPPQGTVLGKALQALPSGAGTILIAVTLQ